MKKLSTEQKAKRFDEALKVANKYKGIHIMFPSIQDEMFPELKESEDEYTISFGAFDSELIEETYFIPEGMEAVIEGDKVIIRRKESEDERIRKERYDWV